MKKLNQLAAVVLAAVFVFASALPAGAVVVTDLPIPDRVFYRETPGETFSGEFAMDKEISEVEAGDDPAFTLSFQKNTLKFDSLYSSTEQAIKVICGAETVDKKLGLAVYDPVDVAPAKGSVTLTVKTAWSNSWLNMTMYSRKRRMQSPGWMKFLLSWMDWRITPWNMMTGWCDRCWNAWWWSPKIN